MRPRKCASHLELPIPKRKRSVPALVQLRNLEQFGDGGAVLLGLLVLGRDGDAGCGNELPAGAGGRWRGSGGLAEDTVEEEDARVDGGSVEIEL